MIGGGGLLQLFSDEVLPIGVVLICFCFHNEFNLMKMNKIVAKMISGITVPFGLDESTSTQMSSV